MHYMGEELEGETRMGREERMEGWKEGRVEGGKGGRREGWKEGREAEYVQWNPSIVDTIGINILSQSEVSLTKGLSVYLQ